MDIIYIFLDIGSKKIQEDFYFCNKNDNYEYYFVVDGHGSKYKNDIIELFKNDFFNKNFNFFFHKKNINNQNIQSFFYNMDKFFINKKIIHGICITGIIYDLINQDIYILNIGDTKTRLYNNNFELIYDTPIHNLDNLNEIKRIENNGQKKYIKNKRYKKLSITRCLGDYDCKYNDLNSLIPIPSIFKIKAIKDFYFFLSTDGLFYTYNINKIISLLKEKNYINIKNYCININNNNINYYKIVDNVCFLILKINKAYTNQQNQNDDNIDYIIFNSLINKI